MRKIVVITVVAALVALAGYFVYQYFAGKEEEPLIQTFSTKQNPAFKAVPLKSPLIIEVKNTKAFYNILKGDNPIIAELKTIPEMKGFFTEITGFGDFVSNHSELSQLLKGKSIILSVNQTGKNALSNLFLVQMNNDNEAARAIDIITSELGSGYTFSRRNYENTVIISAKSTEKTFVFACANQVLMMSEDFIVLEQAIRQTNSQNLLDNKLFTELYKTIEENSVANIFINHLTVHQLIGKITTPQIRKSIGYLEAYSDWSELDLSISETGIDFTGYSITRDSSDHYLNVFDGQQASTIDIEKVIPANASYFAALNLKNTSRYIDDYVTYLRSNGNYYAREVNLIEFQKKTKADPVTLFKEISGQQFVGVYTGINKSDPLQNRFFVAQIIKEAETKEKLGKLAADYHSGKRDSISQTFKYKPDNKNSFDIYRLPFGNMAESIFGSAFSGIQGNYCVLYRKHLIWGDNLTGLKNYLQQLVSGKTLANDSVYMASTKNRQSDANFYAYGKIPKVFGLKDALLKTELSTSIAGNEEVIRKFHVFTWQFSVSDRMIKNRIQLVYDPKFKEEPHAIWQLKLDAPLAGIPQFVLNHKDTSNLEMIVHDKSNNVYLITKEGVVLWKLKLQEEIMGDIHQIDLYGNKRFQYVFNSKTQLYVIDRTGTKVGKFPMVFKSMASNGVTATEYKPNREPRFIVAGNDFQVYVFDRDGRLPAKWHFKGTEKMVTAPIRHFDIEGKDFLVVSDRQNIYFLDRQGMSREFQPEAFPQSANPLYFINQGTPQLVTTDSSGKIHWIDFTGQAEIKELGIFNGSHLFAPADVDGNGTMEYLFADGKKLTVFSADGLKMLEREMSSPITEVPVVCSLGQGINKIGVVCASENKVYLIDKNGTVMPGFPLSGNSAFVLGKFNHFSKNNNLIIGSEDGTLVNYKIE